MSFDLSTHVTPYQEVGYVHDDRGHLVWRVGTGGNVEILHLKAYRVGEGCGKSMLREMVRRLKARPPYATVFGFTRVPNFSARLFYTSCGFTLTRVEGVYHEGSAMVFSARFKDLEESLGV